MVDLERINGVVLARMIRLAYDLLDQQKEQVDELNVFPVPDGDTGTNMVMTMKAAVEEVDKCPLDTCTAVAQAAALGSLMGARGNSGVILSQLFRGFSRGIEGCSTIGPAELVRGLEQGVKTAYRAVMKPVEGTILTVAREAARAGVERAAEGADIGQVLQAVCSQAEKALSETPRLLPVLAQTGVVDAGGKGLVLILLGAARALTEAKKEDYDRGRAADVESGAVGVHAQPNFREKVEIEDPYDVQFLLTGADLPLDDIRKHLASHGSSLLVAGNRQLAKIHVHTRNPGSILDYCLRFGELRRIEIFNMREQHENFRASVSRAPGSQAAGQTQVSRDEAGPCQQEMPPPGEQSGEATGAGTGTAGIGGTGASGSREPATGSEDRQPGIVAVAAGEGFREIFESLGAEGLVQGGQAMNPSTQDLLKAVDRVRSRRVIILPNNKNVILAAEQAARLSDKEVFVLPTRSIPQGLAALVSMVPGLDFENNLERMEQAMYRVRTGEITYAIRDSQVNGQKISRADILGLRESEILVVGDDPNEVLRELVRQMTDQETEIITVYFGEDIEEPQAREAVEVLARDYPEAEVELYRGGQPLYYYVVSVE